MFQPRCIQLLQASFTTAGSSNVVLRFTAQPAHPDPNSTPNSPVLPRLICHPDNLQQPGFLCGLHTADADLANDFPE